jgi:molecular chaperone IbpA
MNTLSLTPLFRQSVGFDRFNDLFEAALRGEDTATAYPPYNIEKHGEDHYAIVMAVAGFREEDINLVVQQNRLTVSGRIAEKADEQQVSYLHRGIAARAFERNFSLADHVKVVGAALKDGLLRISLERIVPEEEKPRMIPINGKTVLNGKKQ